MAEVYVDNKKKRNQQTAVGFGILFVLILIVLAVVGLKGLKEGKKYKTTTIYGAVGGGKENFLADEDFNEIIFKCCKFKADVVNQDEKETKGIRQFLNFGHTFAHALETITKYKKFLHGEAVAVGMLFVAKLAVKTNFCNKDVEPKIKDLLENFCFDKVPVLSVNNSLLLFIDK